MVLAIRTVSGEQQLDLELPADIPVCAVKDKIAEHWSVPPSCQMLVLHGTVLQGHELIPAPREGDGALLALTMVLTLEAHKQALEGRSLNQKMGALRDLSFLGVKGGKAGVALVSARLEDRLQHVRDAAALIMGKVAGVDDPEALSIILGYLLHQDAGIRRAAACATAEVARAGNSQVIGCLCDRLQDEPEVVCAALEALSKLAHWGDATTAAQLLGCLQHPNSMVRVDAVRAVGVVMERGAQDPIALLHDCFQDQEPCVRQAAAEALGSIAPKGSQEALSRLEICLDDGDFFVRRAAVLALADIAEKDDSHILAVLKKSLKDEYHTVRQEAEAAIEKLVIMPGR